MHEAFVNALFHHNYLEIGSEVEPLFRSTPTSFFVTLYNLNYNVPIDKSGVLAEKQVFDEQK